MRRWALRGAVALSSLTWGAGAARAEEPREPKPYQGTLFIVLVDDTASMQGQGEPKKEDVRGAVKTGLTELLNKGMPADGKLAGIPKFEGDEDVIVPVFFGIHQRASRCAGTHPLLRFPSLYGGATPVGALARSFSSSCRFTATWAPVETAKNLVLPFVAEEKSLPPEQWKPRTIIVTATDLEYNLGTYLPSAELAILERIIGERLDPRLRSGVVNTGAMFNFRYLRALPLDKYGKFLLNEQPERRVAGMRPKAAAWLMVQEATPSVAPSVKVAGDIELSRWVTADQQLGLRPRLNAGVIQIEDVSRAVPSPGAGDPAARRLAPIRAWWEFCDDTVKDGCKSWHVKPNVDVPIQEVDLTSEKACDPRDGAAHCARTPQGTTLWLFGQGDKDLDLGCGDVEIHPARVKVHVDFHWEGAGPKGAHVVSWEGSFKIQPTLQSALGNAALCKLAALYPDAARRVAAAQDAAIADAAIADAAIADAGLAPAITGGAVDEFALTKYVATREKELAELQRWIAIVSVLSGIAALSAGAALWIFRWYRAFAPALAWAQHGAPVIDFTAPPQNLLLVGTLRLHDPGSPPWVMAAPLWMVGAARSVLRAVTGRPAPEGRLALHPPRGVTGDLVLEVDPLPPDIRVDGRDAPLLGFAGFADTGAGEEQDRVTTRRLAARLLSDGASIDVFLRPGAIVDVREERRAGEAPGERIQTISFEVVATLRSRRRARLSVDLPLTLRPERERAPVVTFTKTPPPSFALNKQRLAGKLRFKSRAEHAFSVPFSARYHLDVKRDGRRLQGAPVVLSRDPVLVGAGESPEVDVSIVCDGREVENPDPTRDTYDVRLIGPAGEGVDVSFDLLRDTTRTDVTLAVEYRGSKHEVFWSGKEKENPALAARRIAEGPGASPKVEGDQLVFPDTCPVRFEAHDRGRRAFSHGVMSIVAGNSATSGRGRVYVKLITKVIDKEGGRVILAPGRVLRDGLGVFEGSAQQTGETVVEIPDGRGPVTLDVRFDSLLIDDIAGGEIPVCEATVEVQLWIRGDNDTPDVRGTPPDRTVVLCAPISIEPQPGRTWLCIDFGTSAICAALGDSRGKARLLDLQVTHPEAPGDADRNYAALDAGNVERGSPFLPSWIRMTPVTSAMLPSPSKDQTSRPGYPRYLPARSEVIPGAAAYLRLPATVENLARGEGVVHSLKSWIGAGGEFVQYTDVVRDERGREVLDGGDPRVEMRTAPLDKTVQSGFAALASAYLDALPEQPGRVILTHPNTFTDLHRDRLHALAAEALVGPLRLTLKDRISLISESDAAAYYACLAPQRERPSSAMSEENLLVFDFGAGTLDITVCTAGLRPGHRLPVAWKTRARTGVPLAGNYLDSLLARLVHEALSSHMLVEGDASFPEALFRYEFPLVGRGRRERDRDHRMAVLAFWHGLRRAKHGYRSGRFEVELGVASEGPTAKRVVVAKQAGLADMDAGDGLSVRGDRIVLSLPEPAVFGEPESGLARFVAFVTVTVVDEALALAGLSRGEVHTLVVTGRGALWPPIWRALTQRESFPGLVGSPLALGAERMKSAVAEGAILAGLHDLGSLPPPASLAGKPDREAAPIGILLEQDQRLELIGEKGGRFDLSASPDFRLVQVMCRLPFDPAHLDPRDLKRHFYIDVPGSSYARSLYWGHDKVLDVVVERDKGRRRIYLCNTAGDKQLVDHGTAASEQLVPAPWPIGNSLLDPEEA